MTDQPAILGGTPVFAEPLPLVRPLLPPYELFAADVAELVGSGMLTKGKHLRTFEERLAATMGVKHAVCVSSCTLGLVLTFQALGLQGEVIVPSFTFMATVHPLVWNGLTPVFADIDAHTWNLDPERVQDALTPHTTAIVAVHNFGNPANVAAFEALAHKHGLPLIFDAAHGFGARYRGRPVGSFGDAEVFSLSPTKLLVTGEGGVVATDRDDVAAFVRTGREYGNPGDYGSDFPGLNARMPEFNALLGIHGLALLEENASRRNRIADELRRRLGALPGLTFQQIHPEDRSSYKDFSVLVDEDLFGLSRDDLALALKYENVDTRRYHYPPVHTHTAYRAVTAAQHRHLPVTDTVAAQSLSLPLWAGMEGATVAGVIDAIERVRANAADIRSRRAADDRQLVVAAG